MREQTIKIGDIVRYKDSSNYHALVLSIEESHITIYWFHNGKETPFYILDALEKVEHV
jgi:signal peptidase I